MLDIKILDGEVYDGTGRPSVRMDVGIERGLIAATGDLAGAEARTAINADGRMVCPGFIDAHSHSDTYLLIEPSAPSKIRQGVTTEVVGNCGASAAPLLGNARMPSDWGDKTYPGRWRTVAEYRELLGRARPAVNAALLVGHNTLRAGVAGYEDRPLSAEERRTMVSRLEQAMDEGARGLSTGLLYPPGMFAPRDELVELAKVAGRRGGIYASHMRSESGRVVEAVEEAIAIGEASGARTQISHLKTSGKKNWRRLDEMFERIESARGKGVPVFADRYPYTSGCTDLDILFPAWAEEGGNKAILARLADHAQRRRIRDDILAERSPEDWAGITIASSPHSDHAAFRGKLLPDVARELGLEPVDAVLNLIEKDEVRTTAFFAGMSEENMFRILAKPRVMIGSDASIRSPEGPLSRDYPHPRAYGTFPRFLRWSLDGKTVSVAEAIRKMTSLPAEQFGLRDRGIIAEGMAADIVIFDPARLLDTATYSDPHRFAEGMDHVFVNGVLTLSDGRASGRQEGCFL